MKGKIMYPFRKISSVPVAAVLACGMIASVSAPAMAEENTSQGVSVESYTQNLKSQNSKDAQEVLEAFNSLSPENQIL